MSRDFNGTSDYLEYTGAVRTALPLTICAWVYKDDTTSLDVVASISDKDSVNRVSLAFANNAVVRAVAINTAGTNGNIDTITTYSANTWTHGAAVFTSNTSRTVYINGGNSQTSTTSVDVSPANFDTTTIGCLRNSSGYGQQFGGLIAEVGVWSVALTADEVAALADAISPLNVRPASLIAYWPLIGNASPEIELRNRYEMTVTGAVQAVHPRIFLPARGQYPQIVIVNQTVSVTGVEGTGAVGTVTTQQNVNYTVTGQSATGAVGDVIVAAGQVVPVTGQSATGQVGTVTTAQNVDYTVTGQSATGAVGTLSVSASTSLTTDSVFATGQIGTVTTVQNVDYTVTGQSATGAVGAVTFIQNVDYTVTGQSATGAVGTVTPSISITEVVVGQSATGAVGTVTTAQNVTQAVTGQSATGEVGQATVLTFQIVSPTGVAATGELGDVEVLTPVPSVYAIGAVGIVIVWAPITPDQSPGWTPVDDSQSGGWTPVDDSNTVSWQKVA